MTFNPATVRNEMSDFAAVALSPVAVMKFFHAVTSGWVVGAAFVVGISCWYLWKKREEKFARASIKVGATVGFVAALAVALTGDGSGVQMARHQPMKLAAAEGLTDGGKGAPFTVVGDIKVPKMLSILATHDINGYVPGINDILDGGYLMPDGTTALSADEKMERGRQAIADFADYREKMGTPQADEALKRMNENISYLGYGYLKDKSELVPDVPVIFWAFRVMVAAGGFLLLWFFVVAMLSRRREYNFGRWLLVVGFIAIPAAYLAGQAGWIVAEVGRQPWAVQDLLPLNAAISRIEPTSVMITFFVFLVLFAVMLVAAVRIMCNAIRKGPETETMVKS